ncbi:MAG: tRNA pseudouridine(38-40) synthase TruA, partial [Pseudomonadales bacterium]
MQTCFDAGSKHRIALALEYNGRNYHGWQLQAKSAVPTIQLALEQALARVAALPVRVICAGRTDTGVHATAQIIHFNTDAERSPRQWLRGANTYLPKDIRVRWAKPVSHEFHARFSAAARRYRYFILNSPVRSAIFDGQQTHVYTALDVDLMQAEANHLLGEHDFTSYRAVACQAKSPVRHIEYLRVVRSNNVIMLDIKANAFLQHMVRN